MVRNRKLKMLQKYEKSPINKNALRREGRREFQATHHPKDYFKVEARA